MYSKLNYTLQSSLSFKSMYHFRILYAEHLENSENPQRHIPSPCSNRRSSLLKVRDSSCRARPNQKWKKQGVSYNINRHRRATLSRLYPHAAGRPRKTEENERRSHARRRPGRKEKLENGAGESIHVLPEIMRQECADRANEKRARAPRCRIGGAWPWKNSTIFWLTRGANERLESARAAAACFLRRSCPKPDLFCSAFYRLFFSSLSSFYFALAFVRRISLSQALACAWLLPLRSRPDAAQNLIVAARHFCIWKLAFSGDKCPFRAASVSARLRKAWLRSLLFAREFLGRNWCSRVW